MQRFAAVAEDAKGVYNIFGDDVSNGAMRDAQKAAQRAEQLGFHVFLSPGSESIADTVTRQIAESDQPLVTLVGHNDNGYLPFSDGSSIALNSLASAGPKVAVIACESAAWVNGTSAVGVADPITYAVAFRTEKIFRETVINEDLRDPAALESRLSDALTSAVQAEHAATIRKAALVGAPAGGAVIGVTIYNASNQ
ncbi:hypothetical protein [Leifsonia sp. NPDC077715]|uniref:hypothetical protein n=1 Tax=Leifsonia sp. NPDC077715 TaxID=3155539 RepID=UPI003433EE5D